MTILAMYWRMPAVRTTALIYLLLSLICTQLPLFNYLGYEFSAVIAVAAYFLSGFLVLHFGEYHLQQPLSRRTWLRIILDYLLINIVLLLIPLILLFINAFFIKNCNIMKGIGYYLVLPIVTMIFAVGMALSLRLFFRRATFVFTITGLCILGNILLVTYFQPQLFAYNHIIGYFPGITYDETLNDFSKLILFRESTLLLSLCCFIVFFIGIRGYRYSKGTISLNSFFMRVKAQKRMGLLLLLCIVLFILITVNEKRLGFSYSKADIRESLGRMTSSDHFIFYYHASDYSTRDIQVLKAWAEFHFQDIRSQLPPNHGHDAKIEVFIYTSNAEKQLYIGTGTTNIAKPWNQQIHVTSRSIKATLRHEMVHVLLREYGLPVINASPYMALNEGVAVALEWDEDLFTPHQYAKELLRQPKMFDVSALYTLTGFAQTPGYAAYMLTGSFSRYLIDRFGIHAFLAAYPQGEFVKAFGYSLDALLADWQLFLRSIDSDGLSREAATILFSQKSIFYKICPRELAELNKKATEALQENQFPTADSLFRQSLEQGYSITALIGATQSALQQHQYAIALNLLQQSRSFSGPQHPIAGLLTADALFMQGDKDSVYSILSRIIHLNISEQMNESASLRLALIQEGVKKGLYHYILYKTNPDSLEFYTSQYIQDHPQTSGILSYVLGTYYYRQNDNVKAEKLYSAAILELRDPVLQYFLWRRLASIEFSMERYEEAKALLWESMNYVHTAHQKVRTEEEIDQWEYIQNFLY